ncbi:Tellurium resistance [Jatrophihabitans sp. YIM 134969]
MPIDYRKSEAPAAATRPAPVGLTKVTLTKAAPTVSLAKQGGRLHVNLNWNARPAAAVPEPSGKRGFLTKLKEAAAAATTLDLDLGCLWELADGRKGVIQALGNQFGSWDEAPYIRLDGDDRSGAVSGGENLDVNLAHATELRRVLVFASVYSGANGFAEAGGVVTLSPAQGPDVVVALDEEGGKSRMCAVALLEFEGGVVTVRREVNFVQGAQDVLDREYGWGMNWRAGRK